MLQNAQAVRRPRGRPQVRSDEETLHLLVEAGAKEFAVNGYGGASVGAVAHAAGVSTKTLYRLIPTKADLFIKVVNTRMSRLIHAFDLEGDGSQDIEDELGAILTAYGKFMLHEETVAVNRLVLREGDTFPEIAAGFYEAAVARTNSAIAGWIRVQTRRGRVKLGDPEMVAGMLRGMMIMEPQRAAMLGRRATSTAEDITTRARYCAKLFLDGCRLSAR